MQQGNRRFAYEVGADDTEPEEVQVARRSNVESVFPSSFKLKDVKEALISAEIPHADEITSKCLEFVEEMNISDMKFQESVAFIFAYSYDNQKDEPERAENPYRILNEALYKGEYIPLLKVKHFLWGLLVALRSLPYTKYEILYRGLSKKVTWASGDIKVWSAFTSMALVDVSARMFMPECGGTLICGRNLCGYDISRYSMFREESEILLEPFQSVLVTRVEEGDGYVDVDVEDSGCTEYILINKIPMGHVSAPLPISNEVLELMNQARKKQKSRFSRKKAIELYLEAGSKGCAVAYFNIGNLYMFGIGVEQDKNVGLDWWKKGGHVDGNDVWWMKTLSNDGLIENKELGLHMSLR